MMGIVSGRDVQKNVSEVNYRKRLHQWVCLPDMQVFVQARKVNEQLSDVSNDHLRLSVPHHFFSDYTQMVTTGIKCSNKDII